MESVQILDDVKTLLHSINKKNYIVTRKFESVLKKDTNFSRLRQVCEGNSTDPVNKFKDYFNYACITSLDVERSFSRYRNIFSKRRTSLKETTVEPFLMLQMFEKSDCAYDNSDNVPTFSCAD